MPGTKSLKITVKAPRGSKPGDTAVKKAQAAAQAVLNEYSGLYQSAADLNKQGVAITVEELVKLREQKPKAASKKKRRKKAGRKATRKVARKASKATPKKVKRKSKRTVLSAEQRKDLTDKLRAGATAAKVAAEFGVSTATVNNIKRAAGLTKPRAKRAKKTKQTKAAASA